MRDVKSWDVIVIGGGIIGLTLSIALRKRGLRVLVVERGEPGREASYAAAGMLADCPSEMPPLLMPLAAASAKMYPEFVHEIEDESGVRVDLRREGALLLKSRATLECNGPDEVELLTDEALEKIEPGLKAQGSEVFFRREGSVDPRALTKAALLAARHREVDIASGEPVREVEISGGKVAGVRADRTRYSAPQVVNCAGAWAGEIAPYSLATRPIKGQMLALAGEPILRHVVRSYDVYLVPRSDGRILVGSTLEDAGYDKCVDTNAIQKLHQAALQIVPALHASKIHEAWAGLRPSTSDQLPILGETTTPGYFAATGHFRDGILLAPITARVMSQVIVGERPVIDLGAFSPLREQPQPIFRI